MLYTHEHRDTFNFCLTVLSACFSMVYMDWVRYFAGLCHKLLGITGASIFTGRGWHPFL